jgi:hypothetical protein
VSRVLSAVLLALGAPCALAAGDVPEAVLVLEMPSGAPGSDAAGAPPRFVLLEDGQVFVGGSSLVEAGRLEKNEAKSLRKRAAALRKLPGLDAPIAFGGPSAGVLRLRVVEKQPLEIVATGDPALAPAPYAALGALLRELAGFHHPSLRPYDPPAFAINARQARLTGGCRAWSFAFPIADVLGVARAVPAADVAGWPTGAMPASVCVGDRRYVVTLRPLLPAEQP